MIRADCKEMLFSKTGEMACRTVRQVITLL